MHKFCILYLLNKQLLFVCIIGLCDLSSFLLYIVSFTPILYCATTMYIWFFASVLKSTFTEANHLMVSQVCCLPLKV